MNPCAQILDGARSERNSSLDADRHEAEGSALFDKRQAAFNEAQRLLNEANGQVWQAQETAKMARERKRGFEQKRFALLREQTEDQKRVQAPIVRSLLHTPLRENVS